MKEQIKSFLNEEQDPKAIEKITSKLNDLLMKNEEVGYIGVQKKPAITVFPDSIVLTNKRIIICKPKNLGLSMDFTDYTWDEIVGTFVKENILGSEFSFSTKTDIQVSIDYIPKTQARKIFTYAKEQIDILKNGMVSEQISQTAPVSQTAEVIEEATIVDETDYPFEEMETEEVSSFAEIMPTSPAVQESYSEPVVQTSGEKKVNEMSSEELFAKLQNYKKLLDNGLILQGEYDKLKAEVLQYM